MAVYKSKKVKKYRGTTTHGCGSMKKRRGAGNRGGRGNAGTGKRGDANKPKIWKNKYFGRVGFHKKNVKENFKAVNIKDIQENADSYLKKELISKQGDFFIVDIAKLGFNKLLSEGKVLNKFKINAPYASKRAIDKIKEAGGEVTGLVTEIKFDKKQEQEEAKQ